MLSPFIICYDYCQSFRGTIEPAPQPQDKRKRKRERERERERHTHRERERDRETERERQRERILNTLRELVFKGQREIQC